MFKSVHKLLDVSAIRLREQRQIFYYIIGVVQAWWNFVRETHNSLTSRSVTKFVRLIIIVLGQKIFCPYNFFAHSFLQLLGAGDLDERLLMTKVFIE